MKKPAQYMLIVLSISALLLLLSNLTIFREGLKIGPPGSKEDDDGSNRSKPGVFGSPGMQKPGSIPQGPTSKSTTIKGGSTIEGLSTIKGGGPPDKLGKDCVASEGCRSYVSKYLSKPADVNSGEKDVDTSYSYINYIKTPTEMEISDKGTIETLVKDVDGLAEYVKL